MAIVHVIGELLRRLPADIGAAVNDPLGCGLFGQLLVVNNEACTALAQVAAQVQLDGMWRLDGSRSCVSHLVRNYPIGRSRAQTLCRTGAALRDHLRPTGEAMRDGSLGWDAGLEMSRTTTTSPQRIAALDAEIDPDAVAAGTDTTDTDTADTEDADPTDADAGSPEAGSPEAGQATGGTKRCEEWLIEQGRKLTATEFALLLKHWATRVDPDADERGYKDAEAAEYFTASETLDCFHLEGKLTVDHGKVLVTAMRHLIGVPSQDDHRTAPQRNAHALVGLARLALEQNLDSRASAARPHISLVVQWPTFAAMAGAAGFPDQQLKAMVGAEPATWADGSGPIPPSLFATMACDSDITRIVFGPKNQLINLGRTHRVVSSGLRAAIIARDRHCSYPRCDAPPALCDVHHLNHWTDGGRTDADNVALLCWWHHRWVHANGITVRAGNGPAVVGAATATKGLPESANPVLAKDSTAAKEPAAPPRGGSQTPIAQACDESLAASHGSGVVFDFVNRYGRRIE